jgi:hypothetical protein
MTPWLALIPALLAVIALGVGSFIEHDIWLSNTHTTRNEPCQPVVKVGTESSGSAACEDARSEPENTAAILKGESTTQMRAPRWRREILTTGCYGNYSSSRA